MVKGLRILAVLLIVLGAACFVLQKNESGKLSNRVKKELLGKYPKKAKIYSYTGVSMVIVGLALLGGTFYGKHKRRK